MTGDLLYNGNLGDRFSAQPNAEKKNAPLPKSPFGALLRQKLVKMPKNLLPKAAEGKL